MNRIGGKIIPWTRIRSWIRQPRSRRQVLDPIAALSSLATMPDRIEAVAQDIHSGAVVYAEIAAWELGELLGLDWEDAPADWSTTTLRAKVSVHDGGYDFPFAENIQLLEGLIPVKRYGELRELAENPPVGMPETDLPLTDGEATLLEKQYAKTKAVDAWGVGLAKTELVASDGTVLRFEVVIGDAGELEDPKGPYEFEQGEFLDTSEWVEID